MRQRGRPLRCSSIPRCATGAGAGPSTRSARAANASWTVGHDSPACRAVSAGVIPRSAISRAACSRSRAVTRHRGGTCGSRSVNVFRSQFSSVHFHRRLTHRRSTGSPGPARIPRPGQHRLVRPVRERPAVRARRSPGPVRDRPYLKCAARPGLHVGHPQPRHAEQRRRRILKHAARGFLMILVFLW